VLSLSDADVLKGNKTSNGYVRAVRNAPIALSPL